MTLTQALSDEIRTTRERAGMTKNELAEACSLAASTIGNIEHMNVKEIKDTTMLQIAKTLGIDFNYMFILSHAADTAKLEREQHRKMQKSKFNPGDNLDKLYEKIRANPELTRRFADFCSAFGLK